MGLHISQCDYISKLWLYLTIMNLHPTSMILYLTITNLYPTCDFKSDNCESISHMCDFKFVNWIYISFYILQLWLHISQRDFLILNLSLLPFLFFYSEAETDFPNILFIRKNKSNCL